MGIRGLKKFIGESNISQSYELRNTRVVIDGNNICHQLLYKGTVRQFGGNYTKIRENAKLFFDSLLKCNVRPFVVFDGAYDEDDKKIAAILRKCDEKIKTNKKNPPKHFECFPVLVYETFTKVLKELNISHLACEGEADNQIAVLARRWACPVISCDADMYIFDLPGGVINFLDIKYDKSTKDEIITELYLVDNFEIKTGFSKTLLPFAATILGKDYAHIAGDILSRFFQRIGASSSFSQISKNLNDAFALLAKISTKENGLKLLYQCIDEKLPLNERLNLKRNIEKAIDVYTNVHEFSNFDIGMYSDGQENARYQRPLPDYVMDKIRTCELSGLPIDVTKQRVILKPTLEDFDFPPVQQITRPVRRVIYALVSKSCPSLQINEIVEMIRDKTSMTKETVKVVDELPGFGQIPALQATQLREKTQKMKLLTAVFQFSSNIIDVPGGSAVFTLALCYFTKNSYIPPDEKTLKAYVLCHLILSDKGRNSVLYDKLTAQSASVIEPDMSLFHNYLQQFQECLNMTYTMNALLDMPLEQPDPATVYDGKLMYSFLRKLPTSHEIDNLAKYSLMNRASFQAYEMIVKTISDSLTN